MSQAKVGCMGRAKVVADPIAKLMCRRGKVKGRIVHRFRTAMYMYMHSVCVKDFNEFCRIH